MNETTGDHAPPALPWRFALAVGLWWMALPLLYIAATAWNPWGVVGTLILLAERYGFAPIAVTGGVPLVFGAAAALGVLLVAALGRALRADPSCVAGEALDWATRAPGRATVTTLVALAIATPAIIAMKNAWSAAIGLLAVVAMLAVPFFASRRETLSGLPAQWRPRWSWPGWAVLRLLAYLWLVVWGIDWLAGRLAQWPVDGPAGKAVGIALWPAREWIGAWFAATAAGAWIEASNGARSLSRVAGQAIRWRVVGPFLALEARWLGWAMFILPPLLLLQIYAIYDDAQLSETAREAGMYWPHLYPYLRYSEYATIGLMWLSLPIVLSSNRLWVSLHPSPAPATPPRR